MNANNDKSHLLLSTVSGVVVTANINGDVISKSKSGKTWCYNRTQANFYEHRIFSFMKPVQERQIMKAFISSQFGCCPLVWFFCSRHLK